MNSTIDSKIEGNDKIQFELLLHGKRNHYSISLKYQDDIDKFLRNLEEMTFNGKDKNQYIHVDEALEYVLENQFDEVHERVTEVRASNLG